MKHFNLVYKIRKEKNFEKRCGGSSVNGICFNKIKFLKPFPSCKSVQSLQWSYLKSLSKSKKSFNSVIFTLNQNDSCLLHIVSVS